MLWVWVTLGLAGVVSEALTGTLAGASLALAAAAAGAVRWAGLPPPAQVAAFALAAGLLLGVARPLVIRQQGRPVHRPELLPGKLGVVADPVDEHLASGRVVVEGVPYVARSAPGAGTVPAGAAVRVRAVESGELVVERV